MKFRLILIVALLALGCSVSAQEAAQGVARRILGDRASQVEMHIRHSSGIDGRCPDENWFSVFSDKKKIYIHADNDISLCMGLNYYLRHVAKVHVSWYACEPVELPKQLPTRFEPINRIADVDTRFFLNYCTFGYTMVWWKWPQWERFIDWMALNGINMPLAQTGQEAVWYEVWRQLGMTDEEVRSYFSGPTHLPWHRMANLDGFGGPLPKDWIEGQKDLEMQILERERALGMTPVMPAFAGHVPKRFAEMHPGADITQLSSWCGFEPTYFLNSADSLFPIIQRLYLEKQQALFGTSHVYGCDPFNEMNPPSWDPSYLASVSKNIYASMQSVDPLAQWLQMTWVFYYKRKHWTPERLESYLTAVPQGRMMLLDYFCENTEVWRTTLKGQDSGFYGQPFIWCYLGNFGGNTMLVGDIEALDRKLSALFADAGGNLTGVGSTLESFDCSDHTYEYLFERVWRRFPGIGNIEPMGSPHLQRGYPAMTPHEWIADWADCRVGCKDPNARKAWTLLMDSVYKDWSFYGKGTQMVARPDMGGHGTYYTKPQYSYGNDNLLQAVELLMKAPASRASSRYDVVNLLSQWMGNRFMAVRDTFAAAYQAHDEDRMRKAYDEAMFLVKRCDELLGKVPEFTFDQWLADALGWASTVQDTLYYDRQARQLLTTWGGPILNDYANRMWSGLVRSYYGMRWTLFFCEAMHVAPAEGREYDQKVLDKKLSEWEQDWVENRVVSLPENAPSRPWQQVAKEILDYAKKTQKR